MASLYSVSFVKIVKEFNLEEVWAPEDVDTIRIETNELNRPGLPFTGFYDLFDPSRIQIIGKTEYTYLKSLGANMLPTVEAFFAHKPAIVVFTWNMLVDKGIVDLAKAYNIRIHFRIYGGYYAYIKHRSCKTHNTPRRFCRSLRRGRFALRRKRSR